MPSSTSTMTKAIAIILAIVTLANPSLTTPAPMKNTGTMNITSTCPYPVWYQIVPQNGGNPAWKILPPRGYSYNWNVYPASSPTDCDGISIKLGLQSFDGLTPEPITQVEVAWNSFGGNVIYDASDLNSYGPSPFWKQGYVLYANEAASDTHPLCNTIHCGSGENPCTDVYWYGEPVHPDTGESIVNHIHTCPDSVNLVFQACSG